MKMTRQHFEFIAGTIRNAVALADCTGGPTARAAKHEAVKDLASEYAYRLAETNPGFDRARFLQACGVK